MGQKKFEKWLQPEGLTLLSSWARDGYTNDDIAEKIGISSSTFYEWLHRYRRISEAIKKGREIVDAEIEEALLLNAKGYNYEEQVSATRKEVIYKDGKREKEITEPVSLTLQRHKPAETTAQIFWLKHRKEQWQERDRKLEKELLQAKINKAKAEAANIYPEPPTEQEKGDKVRYMNLI